MEEDEAEDESPTGAFRFVVLFASFWAHVIIYGLTWTVGVWIKIFRDEFDESHAYTSLIGAIVNATMFVFSFVFSFCIRRCGPRLCVVVGGATITAALVASSFADSVGFLCGTFFVAGLGASMAYIPSIVIVNNYFPSNSLVMGMAASGAAFGTLIMPPLIDILVLYFDWRMAMLGVAVVASTLAICGLCMIPIAGTLNQDAPPSPS